VRDNEIVNINNLDWFCNTNENFLKTDPVGIVVELPGLGGGSCIGGTSEVKPYATPLAKKLAENGILLAYIPHGPWSFMDKGSVRYCDIIIDTLREKYDLSVDTPLVSLGGSMGGLGSLIYTASTKNQVSACVAACPVYDAVNKYDLHPMRARAMIGTVTSFDIPLYEALHIISPIHRINDMPSIPYFIVCDGADTVIDSEGLADYAKKLEEKTGSRVIFKYLKNIPHGGFTEDAWNEMIEFIIKYAKK